MFPNLVTLVMEKECLTRRKMRCIWRNVQLKVSWASSVSQLLLFEQRIIKAKGSMWEIYLPINSLVLLIRLLSIWQFSCALNNRWPRFKFNYKNFYGTFEIMNVEKLDEFDNICQIFWNFSLFDLDWKTNFPFIQWYFQTCKRWFWAKICRGDICYYFQVSITKIFLLHG